MNQQWKKFKDLTSKCYLSMIKPDIDMSVWDDTFAMLVEIVKAGREKNSNYALELYYLDDLTDYEFQIEEWLEDYLRETDMREQYDKLEKICRTLLDLFQWKEENPVNLNFRIAAALGAQGKNEEAVSFCQEWYEQDENNILPATALIYAKLGAQDVDGAGKIVEKHLPEDMVCTEENDILFAAAALFYKVSQNEEAENRINEVIAKYQKEMEEYYAEQGEEDLDFADMFGEEFPIQ